MKAKLLSLITSTLLVSHALSAPQTTNPPPRLTIELRDGSRIAGTSVADNLSFISPLFGKVKLATQDVRTMEFVSSNSLNLKAVNGDVLVLQPADSSIEVKTGFGTVELAANSIQKISVATSLASAPQHEGLVGFWSGNGNPDDSTGSSNGSLMGNAGYTTGLAGQMFNFETSGSWVKIPRSPKLDPGSQVTIEFWMKAAPDNAMQNYQGLVTSDFYGVEISNGYGGTMGVNFFVSTTANQPSRRYEAFPGQIVTSGLRPRFTSVGNFSHTSDVNGGGCPVSADRWHHIAATYDGQQMRLYIDGQLAGRPRPLSGLIAPMLPESFLAIGAEDGRTTCPDCLGNRYFKGAIGNVAIYRRALTPEEIREDYEMQKFE